MKFFILKDKLENEESEIAWIVCGKVYSSNVFSGNGKPVQNGYYFFMFLPFTKGLKTYTCPNTFLPKTDICIKRVGIRIIKTNYRLTEDEPYSFIKCLVDYPISKL